MWRIFRKVLLGEASESSKTTFQEFSYSVCQSSPFESIMIAHMNMKARYRFTLTELIFVNFDRRISTARVLSNEFDSSSSPSFNEIQLYGSIPIVH